MLGTDAPLKVRCRFRTFPAGEGFARSVSRIVLGVTWLLGYLVTGSVVGGAACPSHSRDLGQLTGGESTPDLEPLQRRSVLTRQK